MPTVIEVPSWFYLADVFIKMHELCEGHLLKSADAEPESNL